MSGARAGINYQTNAFRIKALITNGVKRKVDVLTSSISSP